ncbi:MAG: rRNA maturation RNase YbeY [Solirubrobacterales bacterium]
MGRVVAGLEVEVIGAQSTANAPSLAQVRRLCAVAAAAAGVQDGHVAIEFVDAARIAQLNAEHRGKDEPTDVLSFPIDGTESPAIDAPATHAGVPRELGDVVICPEHTVDIREAIVHGVLHLVGMDHESDEGEMLAVQAELLRWESL